MKKFLFVCGCPRSGTTVLTQLLNWHSGIAIGIERFALLLQKNQGQFHPDLYSLDRFFSFHKDDCFYDSFNFTAYTDWYCKKISEDKYSQSIYVGDKIPKLYKYFDVLRNNFNDIPVKIIFIARDVAGVASSYDARAKNPKDNWRSEDGFKKGILEWNEAIHMMYKEFNNNDRGNEIIVVNYETFFTNYNLGKQKLELLFQALELPVEQNIYKGYSLLEKQFNDIVQRKPNKQDESNEDIYNNMINSQANLQEFKLIMSKAI